MAEPRKPQDHQAKKEKTSDVEPEEYFTFTVGDVEYTMPHKTLDVVTTGFIRKHRKLDEYDYVFTVLELLAGDSKEGQEILEAVDSLPRKELPQFLTAFEKHMGASLGE